MKATATVEEINSVQRRVKIKIPSERVNKAFDHQFLHLRKKVNVKGFRPGKAPLALLRKMYNTSVAYDVIDELINEHLFTAIREGGVKPVSRPFVESTKPPVENEEYELSAIVDVLPKLDLQGMHKDLTVSYPHQDMPASAVEERLQHIAREHARAVPLPEDAVCEKGNLAKVTCEASRNKQPHEGLSYKGITIEVGKHYFPVDEVEDAILGMKVSEVKELVADLKGQKVAEVYGEGGILFKITVHELKKLEIPALDDELAKDMSFDSLVAMREAVEKNLEAHYAQINRDALHRDLLIELQNRIPFEVPPSFTDQVIDNIIADMRFKNEGDYKNALANEELRKKILPEAKMRAKNTLLLQEVIHAENLTTSDEEVREHLKRSSEETDPDKLQREIEKNFKEYGGDLREQILLDKALKYLQEHAHLTKIPPAS